MKTLSVALLLICCSFGCSTKDAKFCECMTVSKELNVYTTKALQGKITASEVLEAQKLKQQKSEKCKDYTAMSATEMLEKQKNCK